MGENIKILIVDDAAFIVKAVTEILEKDPDIEVVGVARTGREGLEKIKELKPDVVTLDVDMPIMDGISALRHIMIEAPTAVVMLSSLFTHGDITFEAMRLGVVDFLPKPSGAVSKNISDARREILDRVKIAKSMHLKNIHRVKVKKITNGDKFSETFPRQTPEFLVAVGTTLGGPNTIIRLMSQLSPDLPASVVITLEISPRIMPEFVKAFNDYTPWKIVIAKPGMELESGVGYIFAYEDPLIIESNKNNLPSFSKPDNGQRPLDGIFSSVAKNFGPNALGVLLTGIGDDGVKGFGEIKTCLGVTIAQNCHTCVYPNLSQCASESGFVDFIVESDSLCSRISRTIEIKKEMSSL